MTRLNYYYATVKIFTSLLIIESFGCHQFGNVELIEFLLDGVGGEGGSVGLDNFLRVEFGEMWWEMVVVGG